MMSGLIDKYYDFREPDVRILIDGTSISSKGLSVSEVEVERVLNGAGSFRFVVPLALDVEFNPEYEDIFSFGKEVEIRLGYRDRFETVITGIITGLTYHFEEENFLDLEVEGYDLLFLLMKNRRTKSWNNMTISSIVEDIAGFYPFNDVQIEKTYITFDHLRQENETDFSFVKNLSQKVGCEFFADENGGFVFRKPALKPSTDITLRFGRELLFFRPTIDISNLVNEVVVKGWNPEAKKEVVGHAVSGDENLFEAGEAGTAVVRKTLKIPAVREEIAPVKTQEEADKLASSILNETSLNYVKGSCTAVGLPDVKVGTVVELKGLGKKFSKRYYIDKVIHRFTDNGFSTKFEVKRSSI